MCNRITKILNGCICPNRISQKQFFTFDKSKKKTSFLFRTVIHTDREKHNIRSRTQNTQKKSPDCFTFNLVYKLKQFFKYLSNHLCVIYTRLSLHNTKNHSHNVRLVVNFIWPVCIGILELKYGR